MKKNGKPAGYEAAEKKAGEILRQEDKLLKTLNDAKEKISIHRHKLKKMLKEIELLILMIRSYTAGNYRQMPWKTILMALAAIVYFVNPLDIIPDFIAMFGFVDDAAVIGFVINAIREDISQFENYLDSTDKTGSV